VKHNPFSSFQSIIHNEKRWKRIDNEAAFFADLLKDEAGKFGKNYFSLTRLIMTQLHDARFDENFGTLDDFEAKCKSGDLPSYTFLEPNYGGPNQNDQHPPSDIRAGEQLIADIYNMVKASPAFSETLLVITYDEHGGCNDHVSPPKGAKNPDLDNQPARTVSCSIALACACPRC
jgi:phospholipase C